MLHKHVEANARARMIEYIAAAEHEELVAVFICIRKLLFMVRQIVLERTATQVDGSCILYIDRGADDGDG
jgi:hypothetical protein